MKIIITIIALFAITTTSFAQTSVETFETMNFTSSKTTTPAKTEKTTKAASAFKIGRLEEAGEFQLFVPMSFSPNEDGIDDNLAVESNSVLTFEIMIFDQWGNFKLASSDATFNWDGTVNGKKLRGGIYMYIIKLTTMGGQSKKYSGSIIIEE